MAFARLSSTDGPTLVAVAVFLGSMYLAAQAVAQDASTPTGLARGPHGEQLIRLREQPPAPGAKLQFKQIAADVSQGQVVGTDQSFDITRMPATFRTTLKSGEMCTATLIGPRVLLTAAHCVDAKWQDRNGAWLTHRGKIALANGSSERTLTHCDMAPAYIVDDPKPGTVRNDNDYALCEISAPMTPKAERISTDASKVSSGQRLLIAGYGCTDADVVDGQVASAKPGSATLHAGTNTVEGGGPDGWLLIRGKVGSTDAILCPGDSGGGAFADAPIQIVNDDRGWRAVAINSAVGPGVEALEYVSYLAPLSDPDFVSFLGAWRGKRPMARRICGLDDAQIASACRK